MSEEATATDRAARRWSRWRAFSGMEWAIVLTISTFLAITLLISVFAIT